MACLGPGSNVERGSEGPLWAGQGDTIPGGKPHHRVIPGGRSLDRPGLFFRRVVGRRGSPMGLLPIADVENLLAYASPETRDIVSELRSLVSSACLHATESILWGSLSYHDRTKGGRVKGATCGIAFRERPLRLTFIHGARLTHPLHLLQGDRLSLRHVEIPSFDRALGKPSRPSSERPRPSTRTRLARSRRLPSDGNAGPSVRLTTRLSKPRPSPSSDGLATQPSGGSGGCSFTSSRAGDSWR